MKPTKMRNNQIYRASLRTKSNQLGSPLSKDLRDKYGKRSVRVVKGDTVKVVRGEYKDVDGKVSRVSTQKNSVAIEGIKKEKEKGEKFDVFIHSSNILVTDLNTDDSWRMQKIEGKKKTKEPSAEEKPKEETKSTEEKPKEESAEKEQTKSTEKKSETKSKKKGRS